MQSCRSLNNHQPKYNKHRNKKQQQYIPEETSQNYLNEYLYYLEKSSNQKYYYKKNPLRIFSFIAIIILISIYSLIWYFLSLIFTGFINIVKKINGYGYLIRKSMIYVSLMLMIEIMVIGSFLFYQLLFFQLFLERSL
tara:strand:+ start:98 stop:511 length:414 start_codon:yes stop_codon:yes gene_type:complete